MSRRTIWAWLPRNASRMRSAPASPSEVEARNLFGARDLHIVDVYDVAGDGKTKRTYGRVYYVEKKLLVFYAFDSQLRNTAKTKPRAPSPS
jgi:hypothetical protein